MRHNANTARRKRGQAGFSLTELLATLVILALVGTVVVNAMPAARDAYVAATDTSNAQVLLSTTTERLRSELGAAKPDTVKVTHELAAQDANALVKFESYDTGLTVTIFNSATGLKVRRAGKTASTSEEPLVVEQAAKGVGPGGLKTHIDRIFFSNGIFTVGDLQVQRGGTKVEKASIGELKVRALAS